MKKLFLPLLILIFLGTSCSSGKKGADAAADTSTSESADGDFVVDSDEEDLFLEDSEEGAEEEVATDDGAMPEEEIAPEVAEEEAVDLAEEPAMAENTAPSIETGGCQTANYKIKSGETLMQIAFNLYGDYKKWPEIARMNGELNANALETGTIISYCGGSELSWQPQGNPHVIRIGETLGIISNDKYGTIKRWKEIWDNNRPLIHNPNKIFAGFTLYYIPDTVAQF